MKSFLNTILLVCFLFCFIKNSYAQDFPQTDKMKRNCIKIGTTSLIKYYLSYEHAVAKHFSAGVMASYNATTFTGYTGTIFTRFYFSPFDKSGWFAEAKGSYAYFEPTAYSDYYYLNSYSTYPTLYGEHTGYVNYLYAGISGGYKIFFSKRFFFESLAGLHYGKATFGQNSIYMYPPDVPGGNIFGGYTVKDVFSFYGPAFPFHIMINFGFAF
jgi:hypothetical protein